MRTYRRVTLEDRCQIKAYLQAKITVAEIAKQLGFHKSTIFRELARSGGRHKYNPICATRAARQRYRRCRRPYKIQGQLEQLVVGLLFCDWSPQQIAVRLRQEGYGICHEAIYQHILRYHSVLKPSLRRFNKRGAISSKKDETQAEKARDSPTSQSRR